MAKKAKKPPKGASSGYVEFVCTECKVKDFGPKDEQPAGWAWRPASISTTNKKTGETTIRNAWWAVECHDCRRKDRPIWEHDDRDCVPKEWTREP